MQFSSQVEGNQTATDITASNKKEKGISDNIGVHQKHTLPSGGVSSSTEFVSKILKGTEDWEADAMDKYSIEKQGMSKNGGSVGKDNSISILEEFFGNALSKGGGNLPTYVEVICQQILVLLCSLLISDMCGCLVCIWSSLYTSIKYSRITNLIPFCTVMTCDMDQPYPLNVNVLLAEFAPLQFYI